MVCNTRGTFYVAESRRVAYTPHSSHLMTLKLLGGRRKNLLLFLFLFLASGGGGEEQPKGTQVKFLSVIR